MSNTSNNNSQPEGLFPTPALGSFPDVLDYVEKRLSQPVSVPAPFTAPVDIKIFQQTVEKGFTLLPERYHAAYVEVLAHSLELAEEQLTQVQTSWRRKSKRQAILDKLSEIFAVLAAPLVQLSSKSHETELKAYLALASNLYQRFLSDAKIARLHRTVVSFPQVDPLGFFTSDSDEPGIWSPSDELPVALVSKPARQMNCLPLWVIDGHEVGGHGIYSHLAGFETEIAAALSEAITKTTAASTFNPLLKVITGPLVNLVAPARGKQNLASADFFAHIVRTYSQEFAADMAGVLNLGPMFVNGLIIYLANRNKDKQLSHSAYVVGKERLNAYPPDIMRALVAVEALKHLNLKNGDKWRALLNQRIVTAFGGTMPDHFSFLAEQGMYKITVPASDIIALVPTIATALIESKLPCLADRSLKEVLTWTDNDEKIVAIVSKQLMQSDCQLEELEDLEARHVAAAALHALEQSISKTQANALANRVHKNGLATLKMLYAEQCILCAIPLYGKTKRGTGDSQFRDLQDLLKRVRDFKSRN